MTPADSDGFASDMVLPGESRTYTYPNRQRAATLWYHDHAMDRTGENIYRGLAGFYIINDEEELASTHCNNKVPMMCMPQAVEVFASGLVAGIFVMSAFAVVPAAAMLDASVHVLMRQHLTRPLSKFMPPLMLLPIGASIAALTLCRTSVSLSLDALACFLSLATVTVTVVVNGPLSRRFSRWNSEALPRNWQRDIRRRNIAHSVRMVAAVGAFVAAILATS